MISTRNRYLPILMILAGSVTAAYSRAENPAAPAHAASERDTRRAWQDAHLRINQVQFLGSHNSYKLPLWPEVMARYAALDPEDARALDYAHAPLTEQLTIGLRQLEIDVFHDPEGGLYAKPLGASWAGNAHPPHDPQHLLEQPGFKVLHKPDVDYRSHCLLFTACLREIRAWSDAHPGHAPIAIAMNTKDEPVQAVKGSVIPKRFDAQAYAALEREVLSVFPRERLITPGDVLAGTRTALDGAGRHGWPTLGKARDKLLFFIDEPVETWAPYVGPHGTLADKLFFVASRPGEPQPGYASIPNPVKHGTKIRRLVEDGWLVRVMSEQGTVEPRAGDLRRARAAFASGAQFVSTDYYYEDQHLATGYRVSALPQGGTIGCNPLTAPSWCDASLLDPYSPAPLRAK